jgi:tetratricopeptide (TPR) repeat protein/protein-L-isoaspartate O-methyltransferase
MSLLRRLIGGAREAAGTARHRSSPATESPLGASQLDKSQVIAEVAALAASGRYADAYVAVNRALARASGDISLLFAKATVLLDWGRFRQSREVYEEAQRGGLRSAVLHRQLGWACFKAGDLESAETNLENAVAIDPHEIKSHFCLAVVLKERGRIEDAAASLQRAVDIQPGDFDAQLMLGNCKLKQGDARAAESCFRCALAIHDDRPAAWTNLGFALRLQDRLTEAVESFERAYSLEADDDENSVDAYFNLAVGYADVGRAEEARGLFEANMAQRPLPDAHFNYALVLLGQGQLEEAWPHHEFRWLMESQWVERPDYGKPVWAGQSLKDRTILIRAEQGLGDTIQFLRYVPLLKAQGATVLLKVPPELEKLTHGVPGIDGVLPRGETPLDFDFYIHAMSLPGAFRTTLDSIPTNIPYLRVDPERRARWSARLDMPGKLNVGLVWAGSPSHIRDRYRSIPMTTLAPLLDVDGVRFVSLQKGLARSELDRTAKRADVLDVAPELDDFADTAAVIDQLDLVIGVDTAVVHLAGALGKPVWNMLPTPADWRWMDNRDGSPWYPTMRLFRQTARGDWTDVVGRVKEALANQTRNEVVVANAVQVASPAAAPIRSASSASQTKFSAVAETRFGILQYPPAEPLEGKSIGWYGEFLQTQVDVLNKMVLPGKTVLEIGAGVGAHALALSHAVGDDGNVIADETRAVSRRILVQNLRANRIRNVTVLPGGSEQTSVDSLYLDRLGLIKTCRGINAADVLVGAGQTLWRLRPVLFMAVADAPAVTKVAQDVKQFGYRCWRVETPLFNPDNFNLREEDIFDGLSAFALLAIPEEAPIEPNMQRCVELTD